MDGLKVPFYTYGNIYDQMDFQAIMDMFSTYDNKKKYKIRDEFEFECKKKFGSKHAISLSSGTAGLHLALKALDVDKPGVVNVPELLDIQGGATGVARVQWQNSDGNLLLISDSKMHWTQYIPWSCPENESKGKMIIFYIKEL